MQGLGGVRRGRRFSRGGLERCECLTVAEAVDVGRARAADRVRPLEKRTAHRHREDLGDGTGEGCKGVGAEGLESTGVGGWESWGGRVGEHRGWGLGELGRGERGLGWRARAERIGVEGKGEKDRVAR